jgi:hypothetical protein
VALSHKEKNKHIDEKVKNFEFKAFNSYKLKVRSLQKIYAGAVYMLLQSAVYATTLTVRHFNMSRCIIRNSIGFPVVLRLKAI